MVKVGTVEKAKVTHSEKDFLRNALIELATQESTPGDIFESKFEDVQLLENEYLVVEADVNINYTCSIGHDRQEVYYEQERDYAKERRLNNGVEYYKDVKKTRTVTDWSPFSGSRSSTEIEIVGNGLNDDFRFGDMVQACISECEKEDVEIINKNIECNEDALEVAKELCIGSCFRGVNYPGDRHQDEDCTGTAHVKKIDALVMPEYKLSYTYKDEKYKILAFASGAPCLSADAPSISGDVSQESYEKTKWLKRGGWLSFLVAVLMTAFSSIVDFLASCFWIGYVAAVALFVMYFVMRIKIESQIFEGQKALKKEGLIKCLSEKGLAPLTESELALFDKK